MRSFFQHKGWILFISVLGLGALTMLAMGLRDVTFRDAQSFSSSETEKSRLVPSSIIDANEEALSWMDLIPWGLLALIFVLIGMLFSPELRKRFLRMFVRLFFTGLLIYILLTRTQESLFGNEAGAVGNIQAPGSAAGPAPAFVPPQTTSITTYLVSLGILGLAIFIAWRFHAYWKGRSATNTSHRLDRLARVARSSLHDLAEGRDTGDVIMNCYFRMSDVVSDTRNLNRAPAMTPSEFSSRLEQAGLPADPVRKLTGLFETVRYGGRRSSESDVREAVVCLTSILHYCGETA